MTRRALALVFVLAAAGCGGSSGSGGGPGASSLPSGTILGTSFQAIEAAAASPTPISCDLPLFGNLSVAALAIGLGDHAGLCAIVQHPCVRIQNVRTVTVVIARAGPLSSPQPPIGIGTYPITGENSPSFSAATGIVNLAFATVNKTDTACADTSSAPQATAGTVNITQVTSASVKGTVDLTFSDGGRLTGAFDAPLCDVSVDVCSQQLPQCTTTPTCNPA